MVDEIKKEEKGVKEKPLDKMTVKELRVVALEIPGITGVHAMKKDELLQTIKEERGIVDEEPEKKKKAKVAPKKVLSVKEIKKKIVSLRREKEKAQEVKDRKKTDVIRRRINRLKKQTRKTAQA